MSEKERLSITIDSELVKSARLAVDNGSVASISAWVNEALIQKKASEERLSAMSNFIKDYEAKNGEITEEVISKARQVLKSKTTTVRPEQSKSSKRGAA